MPPVNSDGTTIDGGDTGGFTDVNDGERRAAVHTSPRPSISVDDVDGDEANDASQSSSASPSPPLVASVDIHSIRRIGSYLIGPKLGEGAFAVVRKGTHMQTDEEVALKLFDKPAITEEYLLKNLYREGEILKKLHHPHVIHLLEIIETDAVLCLVLEIVSVDVLTYLCSVGKQTEDQARLYGRQMLSAFQYLHEANIVHRDLKAENLMLDDQHNLKIIDFGLSNDMTGKEFLDTQCGSMAYSAPELLGSYNYGKEVDIWSIGVCLYVLLTGSLPFGNIESLTELHALMLDGTYTLPDAMSESLKDLFLQMFQIKARKRITMEQLWAHPWIAGTDDPQPPLVCPSRKLTLAAVDVDIVSQMARMGFEREAAIIQAVLENTCNSISATYHLMVSKSKKASRDREAAEARLQAGLDDRRAREDRKKSGGMSRRRSSTLSDDRTMSRNGSATSLNSRSGGPSKRASSSSIGRKNSTGADGVGGSGGGGSNGAGGGVAILPGDEGGGRIARKSSGRRPDSRNMSSTGRRRSSSLAEPETFNRRGGSGKVGSAGRLSRKHSTNSDEDWAPGHGNNARQHSGSAASSRWANTHSDEGGGGGGGGGSGGNAALGTSPRRQMSSRGSASSVSRMRRYSSTGSARSGNGNGNGDEDEEYASGGRTSLSASRGRPNSTSPSPGRSGSSRSRKGSAAVGPGRMRLSSEEVDLDDFDDHIEYATTACCFCCCFF